MNKSERETRLNQMIRLRQEGWTYTAIAQNFGVSQQRVYQLIGSRNISFFKTVTPEQCVFVGLREWMNKHSVSLTELIRRMYGRNKYCAVLSTRLRAYLNGTNNMSMGLIDRILKTTGLTYEEAFCRDVKENEGEK